MSQFTKRRALRIDCVTVYNTEGVKDRLCHSLQYGGSKTGEA